MKYDLTLEGRRGEGGYKKKLSKRCEDHFIKSYKKCENGGGGEFS